MVDPSDRLERLRRELDASKSDVLRRGLEALERELLDPDRHPAIAILGLAATPPGQADPDPARAHDRLLADGEVASWRGGSDGR